MVNNSGGVKGETHIDREVRKSLQGRNDKPLPAVLPTPASAWTLLFPSARTQYGSPKGWE